MAETTETEEVPSEPVRAKLGLMQILAIVALVIVTQIVMKVVMDTFFPPAPAQVTEVGELGSEDAEAEAEVAVEDLEPANYLPLDPALVVNIRNGDKSQFLQANVQLMTRNAEVYDAAKLHAPALRSALIMLFSTADYDSLATLEGKQKLQRDARNTVDETLRELAGVEGIDAVYLTSMVFQ